MKERFVYFPILPEIFPRPADYLPRAAAAPAEPSPRSEAAEPVPDPTGGTKPNVLEAPDQETERVRLLGRAGRNPTLTERDDPRKSKATFPLAVRETTDTTTWHTIVAFGPRSQHVMTTVKQGNSYEVVGYRHETPYTAKDGTPKVKREIYAARVIPR